MDGFVVGILVGEGEGISVAEGLLDELLDGRSDGPCVGAEVNGTPVGRRDIRADG